MWSDHEPNAYLDTGHDWALHGVGDRDVGVDDTQLGDSCSSSCYSQLGVPHSRPQPFVGTVVLLASFSGTVVDTTTTTQTPYASRGRNASPPGLTEALSGRVDKVLGPQRTFAREFMVRFLHSIRFDEGKR